jgi:hypothetical protein
MKSTFFPVSCLALFGVSIYGQNLEKYIELKTEKYQESVGEYVRVSPTIKADATDDIGKFMASYPRRFRYLLVNNSKFQGLDTYYPDVAKMNRLYIESIRSDQKFVSYFQKLTLPATSKNFNRDTYKRQEVMQVASKFFFCNTVKPDKSIGSHICIALNGLKEAQFDQDYTILEAFCFEDIFEAIEAKAPARTKFVENFLRYIEEASLRERRNISSDDTYLQNVRLAVFRRMESDAELENALLENYRKNRANLSFEISE